MLMQSFFCWILFEVIIKDVNKCDIQWLQKVFRPFTFCTLYGVVGFILNG